MTQEEIEEYESEYFRSYCDFRKFRDNKEEISISLEHPGGGVTGEIIIEWVDLGTHGKSPQIRCFNDAIHVLICFQDVLNIIYDRYEDTNYTIDELIEILDEIGFINSDSFKGDYIPDDMFEEYQTKRKQRKNRENNLSNLLDD